MAHSGSVEGIFITPAGSAVMRSVGEVRAVAGRGLEGDRYFLATGTYSNKPGPDRHATLVEAEAFEAAKRDYSIELEPRDGRRNILTRGVALNHLVGREFRVGEAVLRGIRLCEPCSHLESLTRQGVRKALIHRGGLRAEIVREGLIRVGDGIEIT